MLRKGWYDHYLISHGKSFKNTDNQPEKINTQKKKKNSHLTDMSASI